MQGLHHHTHRSSKLLLASALLGALLSPLHADESAAFCGFYVAGADTGLTNNATMVVLMRDGTRTVLSMQNNYQGPAKDFAMVVPVPVVLQEADVKILPHEVFERVDKLAAPRLVEYWEADPCNPYIYDVSKSRVMLSGAEGGGGKGKRDKDTGVTIEAQFEVGEYQVVILSANDSTGLETWLAREKYNIPKGAEPLLRPYVQSGSKFFVAKVDAKKVKFGPKGQAMLSPLRFHYDSPEFALPVRLGLINSPQAGPDGQGGKQDLIVHILARGVRYQTSNYDNVAIPTNLEVKDETREHFGEFYASLFDHVLANDPKAVVTEYAWTANSCDPCPEEPLNLGELVTLGVDVLPSYAQMFGPGTRVSEDAQWSIPGEFVLTRLHARYDASSLGEDLVFEAAPAIVGGRELGPDGPMGNGMQEKGKLEQGAVEQPGGYNNFQARYIIRHRWEGKVECDSPQYGIWGGPWNEGAPQGDKPPPAVARDLAFVPRGASLATYVTDEAKQEIEETVGKLSEASMVAPPPHPGGKGDPDARGCAHCSVESGSGGLLAFGLGSLLVLGLRRRRASR